MNIIVDRPQLVRVVLLYLNKNFGNLTPMTNSEFPDLIFYVDSANDMIMEYDKENEWVFIDYGRIWLELESLFSINPRETRTILGYWLDKSYDLRGVMPLDSRQ